MKPLWCQVLSAVVLLVLAASPLRAQDAAGEIRAVLAAQSAAWNRGD